MSTTAKLKILKWGNHLAGRIPSALARAARLVSGQDVIVEVIDGNVVVKSQGQPPRMTLAQKLKAFDPNVQRGELMADTLKGKESR